MKTLPLFALLFTVASPALTFAAPCDDQSVLCDDGNGNWVNFDHCNQCEAATDDAGNWYWYGICVIRGPVDSGAAKRN